MRAKTRSREEGLQTNTKLPVLPILRTVHADADVYKDREAISADYTPNVRTLRHEST